MKATILSGALPGDSFVDAAGIALQDALEAEGWTVTPWTLRDEKIAYCLGCFECWTKTPGLCRIDDAGRDVAASVIGSHLAAGIVDPTQAGGLGPALEAAQAIGELLVAKVPGRYRPAFCLQGVLQRNTGSIHEAIAGQRAAENSSFHR